MLDMEEWMDIKGMKREGHSIREISRRTGRARNTVRKVLRHKAPAKKKSRQKGSILNEYKTYLKSRYEETGLSAVRLLEENELMGYRGSVDTVRRYLKIINERERVSSKATVRYETAPGRQAQADWAEIGRMPDEKGVMKMVYAFVMVLGFSRTIYIDFTRSMKLPVLIECHSAYESGGHVFVLGQKVPGKFYSMNGLLFRSDDNGFTWQDRTPKDAGFLFDVAFNGRNGWLVAEGGVLYESDDYGDTWNVEKLVPEVNLHCIDILDDSNIWIGAAHRTIFHKEGKVKDH